jgi:hypothetical protein
MDRIVQVAGRLDPEHTEALQPKGVKDPQAADMMRLEAIADLLERLAVTTVTAVPPSTPEPGEGLPAPTLDEPPAETQPETPSKKSAGRKPKK